MTYGYNPPGGTYKPSYTPQPPAQTSKPVAQSGGRKKSTIIILIIAILLLCCCIGSASAGAVYYLQQDKGTKSTTTTTKESTSETTRDTTEDTTAATTSGSTAKTTTISGGTTQPSFSTVLSAMRTVSSYEFLYEYYDRGEKMDGKYVSPDKEYAKDVIGTDTVEEIKYGSMYYQRENYGSWTSITSAQLTGFHDGIIDMFDNSTLNITLNGEDQGYWVYMLSNSSGFIQIDVDKKTNLIHSIGISDPSGQSLEAYIEYKNYNDPSITVQKPI